MKGHICDRCGAFYQKNRKLDDKGRPITSVAFIALNGVVTKRLDLCDSCLNPLEAWLNFRNDEKEAE